MYVLNKGSAITKIFTQQPKLMENPNIIDLKSVTVEHPKTSQKVSKTKKAKKVSQVVDADKISSSPLYSEATKQECFLMKTIQK